MLGLITHTKATGRPTKRSAARRDAILRCVKEGSPKTCAAVFCEISRRMFHYWQKADPVFKTDLQAAEKAYFDGRRRRS